MANVLDSNITRKVMRKFLIDMESQRVLSKTVDTQLFKGKFNPSTGKYIDIKRPHRYRSQRTARGDISGANANQIISGKATAEVQPYITVKVPWDNFEEALELDQLEKITKPAAEECVVELETSFAQYMISEVGLTYGDPDQAVDAWSDVSGPMSLMKSIGVPTGNRYYAMNPFTSTALADKQSALSPGSAGDLVRTAWEEAQISMPFAGMKAIATDSLANFTNTTAADLVGALAAEPDETYETAKDTMTQVWSVTGFSADTVVKAGSVLEVTGKYYLHQRTRQTFMDETAAPVKWRATVTADVTLDASGEGSIVVTGAAINENDGNPGQYDNIDTKLESGDVITILGTTGKIYQPNLFYHEEAFSIAFVKLPKLYSTDTLATTEDGLSIRVSKYSDGDANSQSVRFDLLPAFGTLNPFFAGKGFGKA